MYRRHLMLIAIIVCILFLIGVSINMKAHNDRPFWHCSPEKVRTPQEFSELCMELWTKIDLVQAINTDQALKKNILKELNKGIETLYCSSKKLNKKIYRTHRASIREPLLLVMAIREAFLLTFKESRDKHFLSSYTLLNQLIAQLETPIDIDAQVPA